MGRDARAAIVAESAKLGTKPFLPPMVPFGSKRCPMRITPGAPDPLPSLTFHEVAINWMVISNDKTARQFGITFWRHRARSLETAHRPAPELTSRCRNSIGRPAKRACVLSTHRGGRQ